MDVSKHTLTSNTEISALEAIHRRASVRNFTSQSLNEPLVRHLLEAAVRAPTAVHEEPWAFSVIQDKDLLKRLSDSAKEYMDDIERSIHVPGRQMSSHFVPPENVFYNAGTLITIYGKAMGPFVVADCWLAAENLMLAATAKGLGTCVIGLSVKALNSPEWKTLLNVPDEVTAYAPIIVGYPASTTPTTPRKSPDIYAWK